MQLQLLQAKTNSLNTCMLGIVVATAQGEEKHGGQFNEAQGQSRLTTACLAAAGETSRACSGKGAWLVPHIKVVPPTER